MSKRFLAMLLTLVLMVSLWDCFGDQKPTTEPTTESATEPIEAHSAL